MSATIQRCVEEAYKRGFDAGVEFQRAKAPPLKAREMREQRDEANEALRLLLARTEDPCTCDEDREHPRCDFHGALDSARRVLSKVQP